MGKLDVETLLARAEITDLIHLYCRGMDRVDGELLRSIYWDDAIEDRGEGLYIGNAHQWVDWSVGVLSAFAVTQHGMMNILIEIEGDTGWGESYFQAYHRLKGDAGANDPGNVAFPAGDSEFVLGGRYLDRFERRDGVWKIAHRKMVNDWCHTGPVDDSWFDQNPTAYRSAKAMSDTRP